jgi:hypothetical protein
MKKMVQVEVEVCDICKKNEVARYYHNGPVICEWCGKVLCLHCKTEVSNKDYGSRTCCTECRNGILKTYFDLQEELKELNTKYMDKVAEIKAEYAMIDIKRVGFEE